MIVCFSDLRHLTLDLDGDSGTVTLYRHDGASTVRYDVQWDRVGDWYFLRHAGKTITAGRPDVPNVDPVQAEPNMSAIGTMRDVICGYGY